jgi:acetyltransferase-like isoleucine patch superfamily enzyme
MVVILVPIFVLVIWAIPAVIAALPLLHADSFAARVGAIAIAPVSFAVVFVLTAGLLSLPFQRAIVAGTFPRRLDHRVYGPRRLYGLCWTAVYYSGPIYQVVLTIPLLRNVMLRLFGYRGSLEVTFYSDTWLRDLPLLKVGKGAYLSNKATIGTNICLLTGDVLVNSVEIGDGAMIGHLTMLAPGSVIGPAAEIGVGVALGIMVNIGAGGRVGPGCVINHGAVIGAGADIGTMSYIGARTKIGAGVRIPAGSRIPDRAVIETQADVERLTQLSSIVAPVSASTVPGRLPE